MDTIIRGLFGLDPGLDGSITFAHNDHAGTLVYPFRGQSWTVSQSSSSLQVRSDAGFEVKLAGESGSLRLKLDRASVSVHVDAPGEPAGTLFVGTPGLLKHLHASGPESLDVDVNGERPAQIQINADYLALDVPGRSLNLEIGLQSRYRSRPRPLARQDQAGSGLDDRD
jgi:hypothetical protein